MGVLTATIKSEGNMMDSDFELLSIDTTKEFNKIPMAELRLIDGDVAKKEFKILDGGFFEPGKKIEIALKYEGTSKDEESVFTGIVVNQALELNRLQPTLTIELSDEAIKMTNLRKNTVYTDQKDHEIIKTLVSRNKLKSGTITETKVKHTQMVQYYASDWDFMLSRAEANGQLVIANDGEISAIRPKVETPSLVLELGEDEIYDFDLQVNGSNPYHNVSSVAWDAAKQTLTKSKGKDYTLEQGNYNVAAIARAVGAEEAILVHPVSMAPYELSSWSDAQIIKSRLALLRGWIKIPGTPKIKVGQTIELKGVGKHFTGKNIISGVRHEIALDGWVTHIQIGMDADWFTAQSNNMVDTQAAGLLPGVNGLQIGVVEAHKEDTDNQFLVLVSIPAFDPVKNKEGKVWARLASVDAGSKRGVFFLPEKGDEVVLGFLNDDPRQAVILGSMHSKANATPVPVSKEKNGQKGIFTKLKYQLLFDEENEKITLSTSDKNKICIDEKQKLISLADANGNQVELSKKGVMIVSAKDCQINAKGDFNIEAKGNVKIKGKKVDLI